MADKNRKNAEIAQAEGGNVQIADEVITVIAGTAMFEVEGVTTASGRPPGALLGRRNLSKGIELKIEEGVLYINADIHVKFGFKVHEVSAEVQSKIKNSIETMTGLTVAQVNVNVSGIVYNKT